MQYLQYLHSQEYTAVVVVFDKQYSLTTTAAALLSTEKMYQRHKLNFMQELQILAIKIDSFKEQSLNNYLHWLTVTLLNTVIGMYLQLVQSTTQQFDLYTSSTKIIVENLQLIHSILTRQAYIHQNTYKAFRSKCFVCLSRASFVRSLCAHYILGWREHVTKQWVSEVLTRTNEAWAPLRLTVLWSALYSLAEQTRNTRQYSLKPSSHHRLSAFSSLCPQL